MKFVMFTLVFVCIFSSCSKNDIKEESIVKGLSSAQPAGTVSDWEGQVQWNRFDSSDYIVFSIDRDVPGLDQEILNKGAVLVFVKNIILEDNSRLDKPVRIPFYVLPSIGKPAYEQVWYHLNEPGKIMVRFRTNKHQYGGNIQAPDQMVEIRYFILSPDDLEAYDHTRVSISRLNYGELVSLLGTGY